MAVDVLLASRELIAASHRLCDDARAQVAESRRLVQESKRILAGLRGSKSAYKAAPSGGSAATDPRIEVG
jgi:hypothetical protein